MAGNDSDAVLLLNCDGTNGSTTFTDTSLGGSTHTVTANGDAEIVSGGKFLQGGGFDGVGDYLTIPTSTDLEFGTTTDFCIDFWVSFSSISTQQFLLSPQSTGTPWIDCYYQSGTLAFRSWSDSITTSFTPTINTFYHIALIRKGSTSYIYIDGDYKNSGTGLTESMGFKGGLVVGSYYNFSSTKLDGVIDEFRISKGTARIDDSDDPLYISSGTYTDGFTPPTEAYSAIAYETFNGETTILDSVSAAETFNSETTILNGLEAETFNGETTKLVRQASPTRFYSETTILNRQDSPVTFNGETTILVRADAVQFVGNTTILRREGIQSYYFDLRDDTDTQVNSAVGYPTQTVFTDLFTGLSDGTYTLYARSVQKYKNLENVLNETKSKFRLTSGTIDPLLPNLPSSIDVDLIADAEVTVSFYYDDTSEEIAPTEFLIYADASLEDTITYNGSGAYSTTIGPLAEVSTIIGVLAQSGTDQTELVTIDPVTPDSTPPTTVPITFEVI